MGFKENGGCEAWYLPLALCSDPAWGLERGFVSGQGQMMTALSEIATLSAEIRSQCTLVTLDKE